jgi:hypothetical protein
MHKRLGKLENELQRAHRGAHALGWRDVDIRHAFRKLPEPKIVDLFDHLEFGIRPWQMSNGLDDEATARMAEQLLFWLERLFRIPSVESRPMVAADNVLGKIRRLLAKAESTEFNAEAEALYAKAHELMTRHSIDHARVQSSSGRADVATRRVLIDDPYAAQRRVLLVEVAAACGCQVLSSARVGLCTVFGMAEDVEATELLYTSLLLQATQAVTAAADTPRGAPAATVAAYRRSFFVGFACRVGDRLQKIRAAVIAESSEQTGDLLPVLADREALIDAAVSEYSTRTLRGPRVSNASGLIAGEAAGARASLASQSRLDGSAGALSA